MAGPPVVIVQSGGRPFTPVSSGAPEVEAVLSGGFPITLTDHGPPLIINGINPPEPMGPLDYYNIDLGSFDNLSVPFQLESSSVVLGLAAFYTGDPVLSIAHGGEPLTIIRVDKGIDKITLIAVGRGLTLEMANLTITVTGGSVGGGAFRINEMTDIQEGLSGWEDGGGGASSATPVYTMTGTEGGLVKAAYANGYNYGSSRIEGAETAWEGSLATGTVLDLDTGPTGDWTLESGWSWDGNDLVHTGTTTSCFIPWTEPPLQGHCAIQVNAEIPNGAWIAVTPTTEVSGNSRAGEYDGWVYCPAATNPSVPTERVARIRAQGNVRVKDVRIAVGTSNLSWVFGTTPAEDGKTLRGRISGAPRWAFTAVEVLGSPYP